MFTRTKRTVVLSDKEVTESTSTVTRWRNWVAEVWTRRVLRRRAPTTALALGLSNNGNGTMLLNGLIVNGTGLNGGTTNIALVVQPLVEEKGLGDDGEYYMEMPCTKDDKFYNMNHPNRGEAVIINFNVFDSENFSGGSSPGTRTGSEEDVKNLRRCLTKLEFHVTEYTDLNREGFWGVMNKVREMDHRLNDCLLVVIMTHGNGNKVIFSDGTETPVNHVWSHFEAQKCRSLAGKPKIFIFQACRGGETDPGYEHPKPVSSPSNARDFTDSGAFSYKVPSVADSLLVFSSPPGQVSYRNDVYGSWLIEEICRIFERDAFEKGEDLLSMLVTVCRRVGLYKQSSEDGSVSVPSFTSMLLRKVVFRPKRGIEEYAQMIIGNNEPPLGTNSDLNNEGIFKRESPNNVIPTNNGLH